MNSDLRSYLKGRLERVDNQLLTFETQPAPGHGLRCATRLALTLEIPGSIEVPLTMRRLV
jgi:hypothetical protein